MQQSSAQKMSRQNNIKFDLNSLLNSDESDPSDRGLRLAVWHSYALEEGNRLVTPASLKWHFVNAMLFKHF